MRLALLACVFGAPIIPPIYVRDKIPPVLIRDDNVAGGFWIPPTPEGFVLAPVAPDFLPLPEIKYEEPIIERDEYGPPQLPPIIEAQHDEYGPPPPPAETTTPAAEYGPPPVITTTEEPTPPPTLPPTTLAPETTTTSAPYPPKPYPGRVASHYDGHSGIFKGQTGVFRQVAIHQPKRFF